jgi:tRNA-2-methylthio-N6-dimethylallyladenosine synthase
MNERDSETVAGMLDFAGYERAPSSGAAFARAREEADVIVVNTCSVRENADNKFFGALGQIKHIKTANQDSIVAVCGCMMQQQHIVDRIRDKFPWVDIIFGTHNIDAFPSLLMAAEARRGALRRMSVRVEENGGEIVEGLPSRRAYRHKAFVHSMFGCNNFCSYCIVPYTRGRERSRSPEAVDSEVRALAADGAKEITLLGQNVNSYTGVAPSGSARGCTDFPALLHRLGGIDGIERVRFMTSHPKDLSDDLVRAFAEIENLCPAIHLPVQAGSPDVLRNMNRGYDKEKYISLVEKLREARKDIAITTDFIVGFPGETEDDFLHTMDVIDRVRFDAAFTFIYSPRKGTPAAELYDGTPDEVKHERFGRMVERLNAISLEKNRALKGKTEKVLIDGLSKTNEKAMAGRSPGNKLVNIPLPQGMSADELTGTVRKVVITEATTFSLGGEIIA